MCILWTFFDEEKKKNISCAFLQAFLQLPQGVILLDIFGYCLMEEKDEYAEWERSRIRSWIWLPNKYRFQKLLRRSQIEN
jgi:hypothetical protein